MKRIFTLTIFASLLIVLSFASDIQALQVQQFEQSDPYLELSVDKSQVTPGEELTFIISFANRGPQPAEDLTIILNQPLDARSPLEFVSAVPKPAGWLSSEFGNLPKFSVSFLETFEATEGGTVKVRTLVRDSAIPQLLSPTASIQAPNREIGKQLIVSEAAETEIIKVGEQGKVLKAEDGVEADSSELAESQTATAEIKDQKVFSQAILSSDAVVSAAAFLGISGLIVAAFFAGRKSKTS